MNDQSAHSLALRMQVENAILDGRWSHERIADEMGLPDRYVYRVAAELAAAQLRDERTGEAS